MKIETSLGNLNIDEVSKSEDGWITIQSQSVTYDKNEFFVTEFSKQFPLYTLLGSNNLEKFNFLTELCARTPRMREWFAATSIQYSDTTQMPLYLKNCVEPSEYKMIQEKMLKLKDELAVVIKKRNDLSAKYQADLSALQEEERAVVKKTIGSDNILKIVTLTTECLPLSIQMKIQSYMANSPDADIADNRRRLAQEYLAKFKVALIELNKVKEISNIDDLINEIELK